MSTTLCAALADVPQIGVKEIYRGVIQNEAVPTYHGWPTVANVGNDKLVASASGGRKGHLSHDGRVYLYESTDKGRTWSGPRIVTQGPLDDRDAGILCTPDGTWLVNYFTYIHLAEENILEKYNITPEIQEKELGFFLMRSTDQGNTWTPPCRVPVNNVHGPIVLNDGTLLWHGKGYSNKSGSHTFDNDLVTCISTDDGMTWQEISRTDKNTFPDIDLADLHEVTTVQAADGTLISHVRSDSRVATYQMISEDMGRTWSKPELLTAGVPAHLLKLSDSKLLTVYSRARSDIQARISCDNGKSWSEGVVLQDTCPSNDMGYPSTAEFADGTLFTLWYQLDPATGIANLHYLHWELIVK